MGRTVVLPVKVKLVGDCISNGLGVGCRSRAAAEDAVVNRGEFIGHPVRNVGSVTKKNKTLQD